MTMVDTQRFAIWHPPGTNETKKSAPVQILPEQSQAPNKNIGNLAKDFKWNDSFGAAKSSPVPTSRSRIQSISSCTRPSVAPQPIHLATHLSKTDEDDSDPTSEEEVVKPPPVTTRKFSSSSPSKPLLSSAPANSNLTNTRPKQAEGVSFAFPKETPKENENNLSQPRTKPIEKPTGQGPKVISKQPSPANVQFPEHSRQLSAPTRPIPPTEPSETQKQLMKGPPPIGSRRISPPDSKIAPQRRQEIPKPIPAPVPTFSSRIGHRQLAPVNDQGFVTHNGFISLDAFLVQLQEEAFDNMKLSMMEASIRQFHLIAADADISLTRKLCAIKMPNVAEKRQALIEAHEQFMEAQASSLLTDMSALHDQLKEQHTMAARGLFDVPVDENSWERPLPPSSVPWKTPSPPTLSKSSDSWKPASSPPKTVEVPKPQAPAPDPTPEPELAMPSFWKPSWDSDLTEPPTPQVPPISRLATVEDVPDGRDPEPATPAPVPVPKNAKSTQVPVQQLAPTKNQVPNAADEPTPIWGQPWRKGKPSVSNNLSNQATKPAQVSPPLPPVIEKQPISPPVTAPAPEPIPVSATTPSPAQTKPKTAKQLRAEKNRKGKNKAAASVTKEEVAEGLEDVLMPPPQELQPGVPPKTGLDAAIANMVNTGNFQSTLEQFNLGGWR